MKEERIDHLGLGDAAFIGGRRGEGWWVCTALFLIILFVGIHPARAELTFGKQYDRTNYQEIQDLLFPALLNWVKKGEVVLQTGRLEFAWKKSDAFLEASLKNEGKYDLIRMGH